MGIEVNLAFKIITTIFQIQYLKKNSLKSVWEFFDSNSFPTVLFIEGKERKNLDRKFEIDKKKKTE